MAKAILPGVVFLYSAVEYEFIRNLKQTRQYGFEGDKKIRNGD